MFLYNYWQILLSLEPAWFTIPYSSCRSSIQSTRMGLGRPGCPQQWHICVTPVTGTLHLVSEMWVAQWQGVGKSLPSQPPLEQRWAGAFPCCRRSLFQPVQSVWSGLRAQTATAWLPWHAWSQPLTDPDPPPCWKAVLPLGACQPQPAAQLWHPSLASNLPAACALAHISSQGSGCPRNIPWAPVNLSLLYGKSARNCSLQLPTHTTPCFFTDTYPLTKITIKKPPREMYFWEPVFLTCCHCETYIINKSYAS